MAEALNKQPERFRRVRQLVENGHSPAEIFRETGVHPPTTIKWFPEAGAQVPEGDWKDVPGWPEYAVTPTGLIKANAKVSSSGRRLRERLLRPTTHSGYGHQLVYFTRDGKTHCKQLGRVILETFAGPPPGEKMECCHFDGDPQNNNIDNLRWGTHAENMKDMVRHGTRRIKTECKRGHPFDEVNTSYDGKNARVCRSCSREASSSSKQKRSFDPARADENYEKLLLEKRRLELLDSLVADDTPITEISRTLRMDHRTIQARHPGYRSGKSGGGGEASVIREVNRKLRELDRTGRVQQNRDSGMRPRRDVL